MDVLWLQPAENLKNIQTVCAQISGKADILILPEMFATSYVLETSLLSVDWQEDIVKNLMLFCKEFQLIITGSIPFFQKGKWFNKMITVDSSGLIHEYDKIHLFTPAGEDKNYAKGEKISVWNLGKWKVLPLICYDLRFPYLSFNEEMPDIIIYAANWPEGRIHHWDALLKARAIENQCYVIGVNRFGTDENGYVYPGHSAVFDFKGDQLLSIGKNKNFDVAALDFESMMEYRKKLPFQDDRKTCAFNI
jgi:predicted amidohydrolase